jgi:hypothetical protein
MSQDALDASRRPSIIDSAIAEVLPSEDPFDVAGFDAVSVINKFFPSDVSLNSVESTCERLNIKMTQIDSEILLAIENQSSTTQAQQDLDVANESHQQVCNSFFSEY